MGVMNVKRRVIVNRRLRGRGITITRLRVSDLWTVPPIRLRTRLRDPIEVIVMVNASMALNRG